ncbi:MAG: AMP-binding protein [Bacillota bacterium]|nr:AMP-binding protein [Bacillota bacterium]
MNEANWKYIKRQSFPEMLDHAVLTFSDQPCQYWITDSDSTESLSYARVGRIIRELSAGMICLDIRARDRVAIMSNNSPQWLWTDFSILNSAAITVTIYPTFSPREMAYIINDSGSRILFVENKLVLQKALNIWPEMPTLEKIIVMEDDYEGMNPNVLNLSAVQARGSRLLFQYPLTYEERWRSVRLHDPMTIIYTSGTTGQQKGTVHTHHSMNAANCLDLKVIPPLSHRDVHLALLPLSHSYERQFGQMLSLNVGCSIAYLDRNADILKNMRIFSPSWFAAVPSVYNEIVSSLRKIFSRQSDMSEKMEQAINIGLEAIDALSDNDGFVEYNGQSSFETYLNPELKSRYFWADKEVFSQVRKLMGGRYRFSFSAAGALPVSICKLFMAMQLPVIEGYGLVETCNTVSCNCLNRILPGSVGCLTSGVEGKIAADGELLLRGDNIIREYWKDSDSTLHAFTDDGFFKSGDIVEQLPGGYLRLVDRKKDLLVLGSGNKVVTAKLEGLFSLHKFIAQVCVIGDDRNYITALLVPDFDYFITYFKNNGISFDEKALQYQSEGETQRCIKVGLGFIEQSALKEMLAATVESINHELEDYEIIQKYTIINRRFIAGADELTPTLKLKRKIINKNFADVIDKMYEEA